MSIARTKSSKKPGRSKGKQIKSAAKNPAPLKSRPSKPKPAEPKSAKGCKADSPESKFPVVIIGASAGGLEAIEELFQNFNTATGISFVLVQHYDRSREALISKLLTHHTKLPASLLRGRTSLEPDRILVIPAGCGITIDGSDIRRLDLARDQQLYPIDSVLTSFAHSELAGRATAVILSGNGKDGNKGTFELKKAGGRIFVQRPSTARYNGMPNSTIASTDIDFVGSPPELALKLLGEQVETGPEDRISDSPYFERIVALVRQRTGRDFSLYKPGTIVRRIQRRIDALNLEDIEAYVSYMEAQTEEALLLFQDLLIGVTSFFRDPESFEALQENVIPSIVEKSGGGPIRMWVPGCSSGEEAYSIAISFAEVMERLEIAPRVQIFATDLDDLAVERARNGAFSPSIADHISPARLKRFFHLHEDQYLIRKSIREMIIFAAQDIASDPPFSNLDFISCRNLLIYLGPELQRKIIPLFHYVLNPGGILFLGSSESIGKFADLFEVVDNKWKIYRRKGGPAQRKQLKPFNQGLLALGRDAGPLPYSEPYKDRSGVKVIAEKALLDAYAPASLVVNEFGDILHAQGGTGKYLELADGDAKLNLTGMARDGLRVELPAALQKAQKTASEVICENLSVFYNGVYDKLRVTIRPIQRREPQSALYLITFEDSKEKPFSTIRPKPHNAPPANARVASLESQLKGMREHLQTTIEELETANEELKSTNEELQSSNEELQSTNEELETSREELQSLNDELGSLNTELQSNLEELSSASNDMNFIMSNTDAGIVFLNNDLVITRMNRAAVTFLGLASECIGAHISDLNCDLYEGFVQDIAEVRDTLLFKEREFQTREQHTSSCKIVPYRSVESNISGIAITLKDVTAAHLERAWLQTYGGFLQKVSNGIAISDQSGKLHFVNDALNRLLKCDASSSGETYLSLFDDSWFRTQGANLQTSIHLARPWTGAVTLKCNDGSTTTVQMQTFPVRDRNGAMTQLISVV